MGGDSSPAKVDFVKAASAGAPLTLQPRSGYSCVRVLSPFRQHCLHGAGDWSTGGSPPSSVRASPSTDVGRIAAPHPRQCMGGRNRHTEDNGRPKFPSESPFGYLRRPLPRRCLTLRSVVSKRDAGPPKSRPSTCWCVQPSVCDTTYAKSNLSGYSL